MANGQFVADIPGAINRGQQFAQQERLRPLQLQQAQLGIQSQQQQFALGQQQIQDNEKAQLQKDFVISARQLQGIPDKGKLSFLLRRRQELASKGRDTSDTDIAIGLAQNDNFTDLNQATDDAVTFGRELGILGAAPAAPTQKAFEFKKGGIIFNPNTGEIKVDPVAKKRIDAISRKANAKGKLDFKDKQAMNKDVTSLLKNTVGIFNTAKDLEKLGKIGSGPASIALVFKFMKALDPTSVVRESEFATAENSAGIPEGIRNIFNKLQTGERLGEAQIKQFIEAAKQLANTAIEGSSSEVTRLLDTFGDTLPSDFKASLLDRVPQSFESPQAGGDLSPPAAQELTEGVIIVNPQTGQRLQLVNGQFVEVQ